MCSLYSLFELKAIWEAHAKVSDRKAPVLFDVQAIPLKKNTLSKSIIGQVVLSSHRRMKGNTKWGWTKKPSARQKET